MFHLQQFGERDQLIVVDFGELLEKTEARGMRISEITEDLEGELDMLSGFLDNLATRRPRGM